MPSDPVAADGAALRPPPAPDLAIEPDTSEGPMAYPTELNGQITDAVSQADVATLGNAPAQAIAGLYQATAQAVALAMQNAIAGQQAAATLAQSVVAASVRGLGSPRPSAD